MPNDYFTPELYPFMFKDVVIGFFTIDMKTYGRYEYTLNIISYVSKNMIPWSFLDLNEVFISTHKDLEHHKRVALNWVEERIFPAERQGSEELLARVNLLEYDQLAILKYTRGSSRYDKHWIKFYPDDMYKDTLSNRWDKS